MANPPSSSHNGNGRERPGYLARDTIAAPATATGGALSVIRISGPEAGAALTGLTGRTEHARAEPRKLHAARLLDAEGRELDHALFVRFAAPASYTGEDVVELHVHGGAYLATRLLERLHALGARPALPGEFSFRAVRAGKLTLSQARAVADLIGAANAGALQLALEKLSGSQNRLLSELSTELRAVAVASEAGIDFADQDIEEVGLPHLKRRLHAPLAALERLTASFERGLRLQEGVRAAFVGLPNAGKSSFFNALVGEERSIVSEHAGTTRDIVHERITLRGARGELSLRLEDTAGLRPSDHPVERAGIERSLRAAESADLVCLLVDPASPPAEVREQWRALGAPALKTLGVLTKSDLFDAASLAQTEAQYSDLGIQQWVEVSSLTRAGIAQAIDAMLACCSQWTQRNIGEVLLTRLDQRICAEQAFEHLCRAAAAPALDLFAADLHQTLRALAPLIGETLPDDILGKIFSEFCIGK